MALPTTVSNLHVTKLADKKQTSSKPLTCMKQICFFIVAIVICTSSCKKEDNTNSPTVNPPIVNPPIVVGPSKLIKTMETAISNNSKNIDSFFYDTQKRVTRFQHSTIGSIETVLSSYDFLYAGNDSLPNGYNFTYKKTDVSGGVYSYLTINKLKFNAQNKIDVDSTVSSNFPISNPIRTKHYNYSNNMVTTSTVYPNNSSYKLDSFLLDNNGNTIKKLSGTVDANNKFTLEGKTEFSYGTTVSPFYNNVSGLAPGIVYGLPNAKYLQTLTIGTSYYTTGNPIVDTTTYENVLDASGLVIKIISTNPAFGSQPLGVSEFTYY